MKNKFKKIIYLIVCVIMILQSLSNVVMAATEISKANLKNDHSIKTNVQFKSSSSAANFVTGMSTNGLLAWKNEDGIPLKNLI